MIICTGHVASKETFFNDLERWFEMEMIEIYFGALELELYDIRKETVCKHVKSAY